MRSEPLIADLAISALPASLRGANDLWRQRLPDAGGGAAKDVPPRLRRVLRIDTLAHQRVKIGRETVDR